MLVGRAASVRRLEKKREKEKKRRDWTSGIHLDVTCCEVDCVVAKVLSEFVSEFAKIVLVARVI